MPKGKVRWPDSMGRQLNACPCPVYTCKVLLSYWDELIQEVYDKALYIRETVVVHRVIDVLSFFLGGH